MATATSERPKSLKNARMRDNDETDGVVVPPNLDAVDVVIMEDDKGNAEEV